jgi:glycosyltransferase involved in cell wall biosynthesis
MSFLPSVSVLLPCYNAVNTLSEALGSLKAQSLVDFEVVAIDDGSNDQSLAILQAWSQYDSRFRILALPHVGIIEALNAGLAICQAPLIARMDADDRCHPDRLALQALFLNEHPDIALVGCLVNGFPIEEVREGFHIYMEWQNSLVTDADIRREIFIESPFAHPSVMFRREWISKAGGYQEHGWAEDYDLWLRLFLTGAHFGKIPQVLLEWRETPQRLTRTDNRYSLENFLRLKSYYLVRGPLQNRDAVFIWGAGMMGRRLGKQLQYQKAQLTAFLDIDPRKIGHTRRGLPILAPEELQGWWERYDKPILLAAVGARGARALIRMRLEQMGLVEGHDWLFTA